MEIISWIDVNCDFQKQNNLSILGVFSFTLFRMILGDFNFYAMLNIDQIIGPLFLFSYIYFVYFVLLNMFLAIINETYARIESDKTLQTFQIKSFSTIFNRFFSRKKSIDSEMDSKVNWR